MFKTNFRVLAGLGVLGTSVVTRDKQKLAWIDYDVKKGRLSSIPKKRSRMLSLKLRKRSSLSAVKAAMTLPI